LWQKPGSSQICILCHRKLRRSVAICDLALGITSPGKPWLATLFKLILKCLLGFVIRANKMEKAGSRIMAIQHADLSPDARLD
jgi:hypothetical protein